MFAVRLGLRQICHRNRSHIRSEYQCVQRYSKQKQPEPKSTKSATNEWKDEFEEQEEHDKPLVDVVKQLQDFKLQQLQDTEDQEKRREAVHETNLMILGDFESLKDKSRDNFLTMLKLFSTRSVHRRNHVEFIYAALKNMRDFGVNNELEVYRALIDVMPKGKFVAESMWQVEFMHYPKQQQCLVDLLEQMEDNGVIPDVEIGDMLINIFGRGGHPVIRFWRMMYWMPKFKNLSPWLLPKPVPDDAFELAMLAIKQMCTVDAASKVTVLQTSNVANAIDKTWIVSGQSDEQQQLLRNHPKDMAVHVEGPFLIWLRTRSISYFILRGNPVSDEMFRDDADEDDVSDMPLPSYLKRFASAKPNTKNKVALQKSIHQQDDGTIYGICATGTSTKDSLLSWIRLLEVNGNPDLAKIPVLFKFISKVDDQVPAVVDPNETACV